MDAESQRIGQLSEEEWAGEVQARLARQWVPGVSPSVLRTTMARHSDLFPRWDALGEQLLKGDLPARDRELLILRIAFRLRGSFEWAYHERLARNAGLSDEEIRRVVTRSDDALWSRHDSALINAVDELTDSATVDDRTWSILADSYSDRQLLEIVMVVGQYTQNAFITNALRVEPPEHLPKLPVGEPGPTGIRAKKP